MLVSVTISNFLSFGSKTTISFVATPIKGKNDYTFYPPSYEWDYRLLRSIGIMGFNSAGKSNLLKGIAVMKYAVIYSGTSASNVFQTTIQPFLLRENNKEPSFFEIVFFVNNRKYRYGYKILNSIIDEEWLFYAEPKIRENNLFYRIGRNLTYSKTWNKQSDSMLDTLFKRTQDHTLFLSVLGVLNVDPAVEILKWFEKITIIESFESDDFIDFTAELINNDIFRYNFLRLLHEAKLGFTVIAEVKKVGTGKAVRVEKEFMKFMLENELLPKNTYDIKTAHDVFDNNGEKTGTIYFDLREQESAGTKKFFVVMGLLLDAIVKGKILLFDELDSQFHFAMFETLISFFNNPKINFKGAQLIFTSHNISILKKDKLRRDQLYLIRKNEFSESILDRFHEKGRTIRTDASLEKEFIDGDLKSHPNIDLFTGLLEFPDM